MTNKHPEGITTMHDVLAALNVAMPAEDILELTMQVVPDCIGAALIDTTRVIGDGLLAMITKGDYPEHLKVMLHRSLHSMLHNAEVAQLIMAQGYRTGRLSYMDNIRFQTGPIMHDVSRLDTDPAIALCVVTNVGQNPRAVFQGIGRITEKAAVIL